MLEAGSAVASGAGTLIVIPTVDEVENIRLLVPEVLARAPGAHVLVIDDSSSDGTSAAVLEAAAANPAVELLERPGRLGLGTAYLDGFRHALARGYDRVLTMDADFSHHPRYIPAILARSEETNADVVIGSRYAAGGDIVGWGLHRRVLSFGAKTFARGVLGLRPQDCTGAFRCYRRDVVQYLSHTNVAAHGYSALIELLYLCQRAGYRIDEVPITFADRELGASKVSSREIGRGLSTVMRLRFHRRRPVPPAPEAPSR